MKAKLKLIKRLHIPKTNYEEYFKEQGFEVVCGVDEVGRGAWAGPLVAGAVILDKKLYGLRDSKLLSAEEREKLSKKIRRNCTWGIGEVSVQELEELKMTKATQLAFKRAIEALETQVDYVLIDGTISLNPLLYPERSRMGCRALIKGDMNCSSIAAASIIAKVYRDNLMDELDRKLTGYHFAKHKGYGTKLHQIALKNLGPSIAHRKFFNQLMD
ncbi:TPA: ribonuclease HII [Candidatus Berkelbacteria bacterium]|uniref:Ribonuclease HII n=1 Tax=Berkelbacteria bacterium GW2011_GWE1_39_12 TaxID=1618337 RepID=A0A0G4B6H7_9BACT|nr:MAG: Ribonuclease H, ribonuclease HII [Berkelbacteria bacterium GW2011_GWE1_39_12]HBO60300.1 ribonuclease HII [Candidatus Berkelbacteria bacterium]